MPRHTPAERAKNRVTIARKVSKVAKLRSTRRARKSIKKRG